MVADPAMLCARVPSAPQPRELSTAGYCGWVGAVRSPSLSGILSQLLLPSSAVVPVSACAYVCVPGPGLGVVL